MGYKNTKFRVQEKQRMLNKHDVLIEVRIWGCDTQEEAEEIVKDQVATGLDMMGLSGTTVFRVVTKLGIASDTEDNTNKIE